MIRLFGEREAKQKMYWAVTPGIIGTSDFIQSEVKKLNKEMRRNNMHRVVKAKVQPLPCGMAQMLIWHGRC